MLRLLYICQLFCFCSQPLTATQEGIIYTIKRTPTYLNRFTVHIDFPSNHPETHLVLRGVSAGIQPQVDNMTGDGNSLEKLKEGIWLVPFDCRKLQWEVPLLEVSEIDPSGHQSIISGEFVIVSEFSSLPRLKNEINRPALEIAVEGLNTIYPDPTSKRTISFQPISERPLFILFNPIKVNSMLKDSLKLTYLQDKKGAASVLPDIAVSMKGLTWLASLVLGKSQKQEDFTLGWCGTSVKNMSITGAAGHGVLLVNYPNDEKLPFNSAILLYVPLHEAFHQLSDRVGSKQPAWISESIASYYGCRAVKVALNANDEASQLMNGFQQKGKDFKKGLLIINDLVKKGNREDYGAFYTKGVSFWGRVDEILKKPNDGLDNHLKELLHINYDSNDKPIGLQDLLKLSADDWSTICQEFLD